MKELSEIKLSPEKTDSVLHCFWMMLRSMESQAEEGRGVLARHEVEQYAQLWNEVTESDHVPPHLEREIREAARRGDREFLERLVKPLGLMAPRVHEAGARAIYDREVETALKRPRSVRNRV